MRILIGTGILAAAVISAGCATGGESDGGGRTGSQAVALGPAFGVAETDDGQRTVGKGVGGKVDDVAAGKRDSPRRESRQDQRQRQHEARGKRTGHVADWFHGGSSRSHMANTADRRKPTRRCAAKVHAGRVTWAFSPPKRDVPS